MASIYLNSHFFTTLYRINELSSLILFIFFYFFYFSYATFISRGCVHRTTSTNPGRTWCSITKFYLIHQVSLRFSTSYLYYFTSSFLNLVFFFFFARFATSIQPLFFFGSRKFFVTFRTHEFYRATNKGSKRLMVKRETIVTKKDEEKRRAYIYENRHFYQTPSTLFLSYLVLFLPFVVKLEKWERLTTWASSFWGSPWWRRITTRRLVRKGIYFFQAM